jgi:hypothetical protein
VTSYRRIATFLRTTAFSAALATVPSPSFGQGLSVPDFKSDKPAPRLGEHVDLSGYWRGTRETKPVGNMYKDLPGLKPPFTPAGEAAQKRNVTTTIDPESLCIIGGIPRHNASALPFEVLQGANRIAFHYWYSYYRSIPIDPNRKHSEDPDPSFFGEELGHWEGDTLVIDSIGFKDKLSWVDDDAHPHSDAMHVVERWSRPDWNHLKHDLWVEDPKFYTKPWTFSRVYNHMAPGQQPMEYACNENNKDLQNGLGFGPHQPEKFNGIP